MNANRFTDSIYQQRYIWFFIAIGIIYFFNLFIDVMEVDAAQYASIAMEMLDSKSFLEVYHRGNDYLDKPPMLFWLSAASYALLGISNVTFKLPAVLVLILGIYSTYRFTLMWYDKKKAVLAALILATTQAFMLMTNDVRTDGILTGFIIFSTWQLSAFLRQGHFKNLLWGSLGLSAALMSKGPIAFIIVAAGFSIDIVLKRQWQQFFKYQWLLALGIIAIALSPMCYGLYTQFDLHPEKVVYNLEGPSGIKFFFWTQSFGRITGDIYWNDSSTFFYFFHTILWDFTPWILFFIVAFVSKSMTLFKQKFKLNSQQEAITYAGFLLPFLALSTSNFKLPHYVFPLFPFAAILTADSLVNISKKAPLTFRRLGRFHFGLFQLFFVIMFIDLFFFFPPKTFVLHVVVAGLFFLYWCIFLNMKDWLEKVISFILVMSIGLNLVMATNMYPNLLTYQSSNKVGRLIREQQKEDVFFYKEFGHGLDFYSRRIIPQADPENWKDYKTGTWILTNEEGKNELLSSDNSYKVVQTYDDFHVTALELPFLYKKTRSQRTNTTYLIEKQ
jgi:4-amino-4-deoxy-L-arabinose transferase-like glycosyltransferase